MGALKKLEGLAEVIPNLDHFIGMFMRKESLLSSQIEGTQASFDDVLFSEGQDLSKVRSDVREVLNYRKALYHGLNRVREIPFSLRLLKEVHSILVEGVRGHQRNPGQFRTSPNWIGGPGSTIDTAEFVPPAVPDMLDSLSSFERYYHEGVEYPLIKCGLLHAQFETIHPFYDGNGRIGRLLVSFFLCEQGILDRPLLYLSYYFKRYRQEYYDSLMAVRHEGNWEGWLKFFLVGMVQVSKMSVDTAKRLLTLETADRNRIKAASTSANALALHDLLLTLPVISAQTVVQRLNVSYPTALHQIELLENMEIIREVTGQPRNRRWVYDQFTKIMSEGTAIANYDKEKAN